MGLTLTPTKNKTVIRLENKWNRIYQDVLDKVNDNIRKTPEYRKAMKLGY